MKQGNGRACRPTGGNQVINYQDSVSRLHAVGMNFNYIRAIFEVIVLADCLPGQLSFFAHGDKTNG